MDSFITEVLTTWQIQSVNANLGTDVDNLFFSYVILCCIIRKPVFLLAFLLPEFLINIKWFDALNGWHINAIEVVIYSYAVNSCDTNKSKICCAVVMLTALIFCYDEYFYGVNGYYGEAETFIYENVASINLFANILFISSFIPFSRIRDKLRRIINSIVVLSRNSAYLCVC